CCRPTVDANGWRSKKKARLIGFPRHDIFVKLLPVQSFSTSSRSSSQRPNPPRLMFTAFFSGRRRNSLSCIFEIPMAEMNSGPPLSRDNRRMQEARPSQTALRVAIRRAAHQLFDRPAVLDDPIALRIISEEAVNKLRADRRQNGRVARTLRAFM